ncbi:MAG: tRNA (adenosine(37)-N6)-threonylcarbamoyltransferase complex ATPase subunit type 1 TsaE [Thermodesulfobacteriota bacterium]
MTALPSDPRGPMGSLRVLSATPDETRSLGYRMGQRLTGGTILALEGELGSGKTVFVQGLASGLDVPESYYVVSPTYTIVNEFPGRFPLVHVDLYRISAADEMDAIGLADAYTGREVVAVEWANRLPEGYWRIHIRVVFTVTGDDLREINLIPYGQAAADLIGEIKNCV